MNKKRIRILLTTAAVLVAAAAVIWIAGDIKNNMISITGREGFEILLPREDICAMEFSGGYLWAGGADGLYKIDPDTSTAEKVGNYRYVRAILTDGQGIWIGHDDGLTFIGREEENLYTTEDGLPDNRVNALMEDSNGTLWIGTWGGAAVFGEPIQTVYTQENGLLADMVNVIFEDRFGGMWFGSYVAPRGGISVLYRNKWQYFTTDDALVHANVNAIIERNDGSVLAGGGLYTKGGGRRFIYKEGKWTAAEAVTMENGLAGAKIRSLFEDSRGRLWVGSEYNGLAVLDGEEITVLTDKDGLSNNEVKVIREDDDNNIWIGTRNGLTKIAKGGIH